jgi:hypothetical protein
MACGTTTTMITTTTTVVEAGTRILDVLHRCLITLHSTEEIWDTITQYSWWQNNTQPLLLSPPPLLALLPSQERGSHPVGVYPFKTFGRKHSDALSDGQSLQHANMSQSRHWKARCMSCCCPPPPSPHWTAHIPATLTSPPPNKPAYTRRGRWTRKPRRIGCGCTRPPSIWWR